MFIWHVQHSKNKLFDFRQFVMSVATVCSATWSWTSSSSSLPSKAAVVGTLTSSSDGGGGGKEGRAGIQ